MTTLLKVEKITKKFGDFYANDQISFEVNKSEVLAILGENGAGKTTLMNILFGHYTPDAGNVNFEGNAIEFGDTNAIYAQGCCADRTRGLFAGGDSPATQDIDFVTIASTGTYADSGADLNGCQMYNEGLSSGTRGVFAGGFNPGYLNVIDFVTIASAGNASDFGDITQARRQLAAASDAHGGLTQ